MKRIENKNLNICLHKTTAGVSYSVFSKPLAVHHVIHILDNLNYVWQIIQNVGEGTFTTDGIHILRNSPNGVAKKNKWDAEQKAENKREIDLFIEILATEYMQIVQGRESKSLHDALLDGIVDETTHDYIFSSIFFCMLQLRYYGEFLQSSFRMYNALKDRTDLTIEEAETLEMLEVLQCFTSQDITDIKRSSEISTIEKEPIQAKEIASFIAD